MEEYIGFIQGLLCGVFLTTGSIKTFFSRAKAISISGPALGDLTSTQIKLAGVSEILGAIGIILPVYLNIYPILTPLAAIGLALSMLVALSLNVEHKQSKKVGVNVVLLALCIGVAIYYF